MDFLTNVLINGPLIIVNVIANAFFIFCMICPLPGEKIKQPLKLLLWSLICSTLIYTISVLIELCSAVTDILSFVNLMLISYVVLIFSLSESLTSSVWLNFYYYTQIVPAQRASSIWIKKNVKPLIYCILLFQKTCISSGLAFVLLYYLPCTDCISHAISYNSTMCNVSTYKLFSSAQQKAMIFAGYIMTTHFIVCMSVMVMSTGSTVVYLCRHMCRMVANGQSFSCPKFRSQMRVAVTGLLQGVLFVFSAVWSVYTHLSYNLLMESVHSSLLIGHFTVINFYMAGTTLNVGTGQAVFRRKAVNIWLKVFQWCRALKVQQSTYFEQPLP